MSVIHPAPRPRALTPPLSVPIVGGGTFVLADCRPERFTMVVFYRGLHCPVCKSYLRGLEGKLTDFSSRGVDVIAVSGDDAHRAEQAKREWNLPNTTIGYDQSVESMRAWGLYISRSIKDAEPPEFGEPGLFLVRPDATLYYAAINSMPFGRPSLADMLGAIDFVEANDYPARGEA